MPGELLYPRRRPPSPPGRRQQLIPEWVKAATARRYARREPAAERALGDPLLLAHILAFLQPLTLVARAAAVSKCWREVATSSSLSHAFLRRHWPSLADLATTGRSSSSSEAFSPQALLRMRALHDYQAPQARRRQEEAELAELLKDLPLQLAFRQDPRQPEGGSGTLAEAVVFVDGGDVTDLWKGVEFELACGGFPALPADDWWGALDVEFFFSPHCRPWGGRLDLDWWADPFEPSQPWFRAWAGEERWAFTTHGGGDLFYSLPGVEVEADRWGGSTVPSVVVEVTLTVECAYPRSPFELPLSPTEEAELGEATPLRVERVSVAFAPDSFYALPRRPSRYAALKLLHFARVAGEREAAIGGGNRAALARRRLRRRFAGSALLFEVLDKEDGRVVAFHHTPLLLLKDDDGEEEERGPGADDGGLDWDGRAWLPPVFTPSGARLSWAEGEEPRPLDSHAFGFRVLLLDRQAGPGGRIETLAAQGPFWRDRWRRCLPRTPGRVDFSPEYTFTNTSSSGETAAAEVTVRLVPTQEGFTVAAEESGRPDASVSGMLRVVENGLLCALTDEA